MTLPVLTIGSVEVTPPLLLAPMAGYTGSSLRILARREGCGMVVSEVISAKGLLYRNPKTYELARFTAEERPIALQLLSAVPEEAAQAVTLLAPYKPDVIDINCGCPKSKVTKRGEGGALLEAPERACAVARACVREAPCPVTVKLRLPRCFSLAAFVDFCKALQQCGVAALTVHPRRVADGFKGKARWEIFPALTEALSVPVIASGDVRTPAGAAALFRSGCAGVMIGRAAVGNPGIFRWIRHTLEGEERRPPSLQERYRACLAHFYLLCGEKGPERAVLEIRKQLTRYLKGLPCLSAHFQKLACLRNPVLFQRQFVELGSLVGARPPRGDAVGHHRRNS